MAALQNYKLVNAQGLGAIRSVKGIMFSLDTLTDQQAELLHKEGCMYVEKVEKPASPPKASKKSKSK